MRNLGRHLYGISGKMPRTVEATTTVTRNQAPTVTRNQAMPIVTRPGGPLPGDPDRDRLGHQGDAECLKDPLAHGAGQGLDIGAARASAVRQG